jgi:flavin reductase (NADH)
VPTAQRFGEGSWDLVSHGVPVLRNASASIVGRITGEQVHGSHSVAFVEVESVTTRESSGALVYFQRRFHALAAHPLSA